MPKSKKTKRGIQQVNVTRIPFKQFVTGALASNVLQLNCSPLTLGTLPSLTTGFELYRFTRLRYKLLARTFTGATGTMTLAYYPEPVISGPGSLNANMENVDCIVNAGGCTVNSDWHVVPQERLHGMLSWYKCNLDAGDTEFENQGVFAFYGSGATDLAYAVIEGVCEFKNPVDSSIAFKKLKEQVRDEVISEYKMRVMGLEDIEDIKKSSVSPKIKFPRLVKRPDESP